MEHDVFVFYTDSGYDGATVVGYASINGDGFADALDALIAECTDEEITGGINVGSFGKAYERGCIELEWTDDYSLRVMDIAGRSHKIAIDGKTVAELVTDAVSAKEATDE